MSMFENMNGIKPITLESETLKAMKKDMDEIINKTIKTMQMCQSTEGTITVKMKVTIEKRGIANENAYRTGIIPKIEHDVQSVVQTKDKKSGSMSGEYELVYDAENDRWYMRDIRAQTSMFDAEAVVSEASEVARDEEGNQICIGGVPALEAGEVNEDENLEDLDASDDDIEEDDDPE
ncbi:MAG: hypothetical protein RSC06_00960 [Clostridia bacterium]